MHWSGSGRRAWVRVVGGAACCRGSGLVQISESGSHWAGTNRQASQSHRSGSGWARHHCVALWKSWLSSARPLLQPVCEIVETTTEYHQCTQGVIQEDRLDSNTSSPGGLVLMASPAGSGCAQDRSGSCVSPGMTLQQGAEAEPRSRPGRRRRSAGYATCSIRGSCARGPR